MQTINKINDYIKFPVSVQLRFQEGASQSYHENEEVFA